MPIVTCFNSGFFFFFGNFCLFVDALYLIRCHISLCFFKPCFLQVFEHIYNGCFDIFLLCLISRPSGRQVCCLLFFSVYGSHFHFTACHKLLWKLDILDNVATLDLDFFLSLSGAVVILFLLWLGWTLLVKSLSSSKCILWCFSSVGTGWGCTQSLWDDSSFIRAVWLFLLTFLVSCFPLYHTHLIASANCPLLYYFYQCSGT